MSVLKRLFICLFVTSLLLTACKKDAAITELTPTAPTTENATTEPTTNSANTNEAVNFRALAAAAKVSPNKGENFSGEDNPCGCYDVFKEIDFEATDQEIEAAVDAIIDALSEAELTRLFEPVCTDDGEIYESACVADCEGITNYHICSDEELDDYFFDDFECDDLDDISFPFEFDLPDGSTITINNEEELFAVLEQWYEAHGGEYGDWEDEWEEEEWEDEWDDFGECYSIVYPVQVTNPDGTVQTYNNDEELFKGLDEWYQANPDSEEEPEPVYPVEVVLEDGTTQTINNDEEGEDLEDSCYGDFDEDICFELVFPITLTPSDSTTIQVNDEDELEDALETIFKDIDELEDIDEATIIAMLAPFDIQYEDGTVATISSIEDLEAAIFKCFGFGLQEGGSVKGVLLNTNSTNNSFLPSRKF